MRSPIAPGYVVPVRFLKKSNPTRRVVMEEATFFIVKGGGVVDEPPGVPDEKRRRLARGGPAMRVKEVGDGEAAAELPPRDALGSNATPQDTPKGERRAEQREPF